MRISVLGQDGIEEVLQLMKLGAPYIAGRTPSDY